MLQWLIDSGHSQHKYLSARPGLPVAHQSDKPPALSSAVSLANRLMPELERHKSKQEPSDNLADAHLFSNEVATERTHNPPS
jgi:hypothetical protein